MKLSDEVRRIEKDVYEGKMDHPTAVKVIDALMHHFKFLGEDEILVAVPDDFGRMFERTGFIGEFTVRHKDSQHAWKRSYIDRSLQAQKERPVTKFLLHEDSPSAYDVGRRSSMFFVDKEKYLAQRNNPPHCPMCDAGVPRRPDVLGLRPLTPKDREFFASYEKQMENWKDLLK